MMYEKPGVVIKYQTGYTAEVLRIIGILGGCNSVKAYTPDGNLYAMYLDDNENKELVKEILRSNNLKDI